MTRTHNAPEVFAVIWDTFIPLSLVCCNADEAVLKAKSIIERASHMGDDAPRNVRAVHVEAGCEELITLYPIPDYLGG